MGFQAPGTRLKCWGTSRDPLKVHHADALRAVEKLIAVFSRSSLRTRSKIPVRIWTADPSRLASLLVVAIRRVFLLLAPCQPGASTAQIHTSIFSRVLSLQAEA